jgi:hypothetical protein
VDDRLVQLHDQLAALVVVRLAEVVGDGLAAKLDGLGPSKPS